MSLNLDTIKTVDTQPFRYLVSTIGNLPTSFTDSMSYYELLAWFLKFLEEQVIPTVNNNAAAVEELQGIVIELHDYVENYFANLDVQEEINNKLDQMTEEGTLQEIITTYIQSNVAWTFDTVEDMKAATNLIDGSYAQTLGFYTVNDGGGALYHITNTGTANEIDIIAVDSLKAHIVLTPSMSILQFGGKLDGETDNSSILNQMLTLVDDGLNEIIIPEGTCVLTNTVEFSNIDGLSIKNYGLIKGTSSTTYENPILKFEECSNVDLIDLRMTSTLDQTEPAPLDHTRVSYAGSNRIAISLRKCSNFNIVNPYIENMYADIWSLMPLDSGDTETTNHIYVTGWKSVNSSMPLYSSSNSFMYFDKCDIKVKDELGYGNHFMYFQHKGDNIHITNSNFICDDANLGHGIVFVNNISAEATHYTNIRIDNVIMKAPNFIVFGTGGTCDLKITNSKFTQTLRTDTSSGTSYSGFTIYPSTYIDINNCEFNNTSPNIFNYSSLENMNGCTLVVNNCRFNNPATATTDSYILYFARSSHDNTVFIKNSIINCKRFIYAETNTQNNDITVQDSKVIPDAPVTISIRNSLNTCKFINCIVNPATTKNFFINNGGSVVSDGIKLLNSFFYNYTYMYLNVEIGSIKVINSYLNDTLITLPQ